MLRQMIFKKMFTKRPDDGPPGDLDPEVLPPCPTLSPLLYAVYLQKKKKK